MEPRILGRVVLSPEALPFKLVKTEDANGRGDHGKNLNPVDR